MEEILRQILSEIQELKTNQSKTDRSIEIIGERMDAIDRSSKEEFRKLDKKIDKISEVVAITMEDVVGIKGHMEKQDIELKVLKGGK